MLRVGEAAGGVGSGCHSCVPTRRVGPLTNKGQPRDSVETRAAFGPQCPASRRIGSRDASSPDSGGRTVRRRVLQNYGLALKRSGLTGHSASSGTNASASISTRISGSTKRPISAIDVAGRMFPNVSRCASPRAPPVVDVFHVHSGPDDVGEVRTGPRQRALNVPKGLSGLRVRVPEPDDFSPFVRGGGAGHPDKRGRRGPHGSIRRSVPSAFLTQYSCAA